MVSLAAGPTDLCLLTVLTDALALLLAKSSICDVGLDEANRHLEKALTPTRDHSHTSGADPEQHHNERNREEADEHQAVYLERRAVKEDRRGIKIKQRGAMKAPIAGSVIGGKGR